MHRLTTSIYHWLSCSAHTFVNPKFSNLEKSLEGCFVNLLIGYKQACQFSLPAKSVCHIWIALRLSMISCFHEAESQTVSAGSLLSCTTVSAGSKRSRLISAETKHDRKRKLADYFIPCVTKFLRGIVLLTYWQMKNKL